MAVSTTNYYNNGKPGAATIGPDGDIYRVDTVPQHAIGAKLERADGNVYRYAHFGLACKPGDFVATDESESSLADTDNIVIAPASAVDTTDGTLGSRFVQITLASVTANQYAGGYFVPTDGTGIGYTYRIKGNTATDNPATGDFRLELYDPLKVALTTTTDIAIQGCIFANCEPATTTDISAAGVACSNFALGEYGWIQTEGICGARGTASAIGRGGILSGTAGEFVTAVETDILERVCTVLQVGDASGCSIVRLTLG